MNIMMCRNGDFESWETTCIHSLWSIERNVFNVSADTFFIPFWFVWKKNTSSIGKYFLEKLDATIIFSWIFVESFISLLPDRKLKTLFQRPLNHLPDTKDGYSLLLFWYWEECLKERYLLFNVLFHRCLWWVYFYRNGNYWYIGYTSYVKHSG